ncbi:TPA: DNA-packaging protein [Klebsiella quasipneumoniae subsp. quasipneumoniae]|uniref:DNA-packaging protein n=1 Tax=Klebsiella/Raoultella group TaxID=2890311 RepID=UPI000BFF284D|nr:MULTISPECIES: DNA-packaging protein [Klebsiella/Raoultella group]ATM20430.1 DNA-packaging protein [Raoultella ornithinolytica]EJR0225034.1 DNA-packaging protein [Raoultella planticola]EJR0354742.1 DNA-packaging protein [Raoultella planticola]MEB2971887.1 DNA-packaging protein [Klebsiella pneumoniae]
MAAPKGNKFWQARSKHGRNPKFTDPDILWEACCEYFDWVEKHPLWETKAFSFQGTITKARLPKMRAMTISGLCIFLDIADSTWDQYRTKKGFSVITTRVERLIYEQKFSGAAADLLNANIIARELGLVEKKSVEGDLEVTVKVKHFREKE